MEEDGYACAYLQYLLMRDLKTYSLNIAMDLDWLPTFFCIFSLLIFVSLAGLVPVLEACRSKTSIQSLPCLQRRRYLLGIDTVYQDIQDLRNHRSSRRSLSRHEQLGPTFVSEFLGQQTIYTIDPANVLAITTVNFDEYGKGKWAKIISRYMGRGVLVNDGDEWISSRNMLKPFFRRNKMADERLFEPHVDRLISYIQSRIGHFVDFRRAFQIVVLDITTDMLCKNSTLSLAQQPTKKNSDRMPERGLLDLIDEIEPYGNLAIELGPLSMPVFLWRFRTIMRLVRGIQDFFRATVESIAHAETDSEGSTIIQHMLSQGRKHEEVQGELQNIFFAAFDTSTALLTNLFDCIARDRTIFDRLKAELTSARMNSHCVEISRLVYLRAAIYETLRLHSPVTYHTRVALKDTVLPHGARTEQGESIPLFVPKGTPVVWSTYALHRSIAVCKDRHAEDFHPERWLVDADGEGKQQLLVADEHFMPFGSGPRNCPGQQFALHLTAYVVARVLSAFESMELKDAEKYFVEAAAVTHYNGRGTWIRLETS